MTRRSILWPTRRPGPVHTCMYARETGDRDLFPGPLESLNGRRRRLVEQGGSARGKRRGCSPGGAAMLSFDKFLSLDFWRKSHLFFRVSRFSEHYHPDCGSPLSQKGIPGEGWEQIEWAECGVLTNFQICVFDPKVTFFSECPKFPSIATPIFSLFSQWGADWTGQMHGSKRPRWKSTKLTSQFHRFRPQSR